MNNQCKILFVLPIIGFPRHSKRIKMLQDSDFLVSAIAFNRGSHGGRLPDCSIKVISKIRPKKYVERFFRLLMAIPTIRKEIKKSDVVYAFGPDMAYISLIAGFLLNKPIILEIADIREIQVLSGIKGKIVRTIDRLFARFCSFIVVTSQDYWAEYFQKILNLKVPHIVIENKLENNLLQKSIKKIEGIPFIDRPLTIGYFGVLRSDWSWDVLEGLCSKNPQRFKLVAAGIPLKPWNLADRASKFSNIDYKGTYSSPTDLPNLYNDIDIVWACYPFPSQTDMNWKWARTNRFYESLFFRKPMIVLEGSGDAIEVDNLGIGLVLNHQDLISTIQTVADITIADIEAWKKNVSIIPDSKYLYDNEFLDLAKMIHKAIK